MQTMTCGYCGRSWNDALPTSLTPVPSGRCPFEYEHDTTAAPAYVAIVVVVPRDADTPTASDAAWERLTAALGDDVTFAGNPWAVEPFEHDGGAPVFDTDDVLNQRRA